MTLHLLCLEDPATFEFDAEVIEKLVLPDGRTGLVLDRSYFYPTGGGQEHDTGQIGTARVVNVYKDDDNTRLVHIVEGDVNLGLVRASIDRERRLRHMQHHTAQHLLTQCLLRQSGFETVSANINGYSPSTLDLVTPVINPGDVEQAEWMANQVIYEDRPVRTYLVSPEQLPKIPLRRPPKVSENIRIVEIDGFDYSPCGGTHVSRTGSIGVVKVTRTEKQNDKTRVHFVAGLQAYQVLRQMYESFNATANQMSISWQDLPVMMKKQSEQVSLLQKELQALRQEMVRYEAHELVVNAEVLGRIRFVRAGFDNRTASEMRLLAEELRKLPDVVSILATYDGQKVSLVVTCGEATGLDARQLLNRQLSPIGGRGGGDVRLSQGGGVATPDQFHSLLEQVDMMGPDQR